MAAPNSPKERGLGASAALAAPGALTGTRLEIANGEMGDATSQDAVQRLSLAVDDLHALKIAPILRRATAALADKNWRLAADLALESLGLDERCGFAWHVLALARDKVGDYQSAIQCYESALALSLDQADVAHDLARLAYRLGMKPLALKFFAVYRASRPDCIHGVHGLACVQRDSHDYDAAIETLRPAIVAHPDSALLWNTLGTVLAERGDMSNALTFFEEALRLDPAYCHALYNRSHAKLHQGNLSGALEDCDGAMALAASPTDMALVRLARSTILLCSGRVSEGWDDYEARLDPQSADAIHFPIEWPRWTPTSHIDGKSLLLIGEQGLGDEVMFANMIPDVLQALGPQGQLTLAVEPRLVSLLQRSFPTARIGGHASHRVDGRLIREVPFVAETEAVDLWAPLAAPLRRFRSTAASFPTRPGFLTADEARITHWRAILAQRSGLKVGVLWKSLKLDGVRLRYFSPFENWRPVLETPGVSFVNLQYGECQDQLDQARAALGVEIWQPREIDLKDDLDDVAALCCGLDLVIGPPTATTNIAAACGADVWMISTPGAWSLLGSDRHPWYPQVRLFMPDGFNQWTGLMHEIAAALNDRCKRTPQVP